MNKEEQERKLVYIPNALVSPEFELLLSKAQEILDAGENLDLITCSGKKNYACSLNIYGQASICFSCKSRFKSGIKELRGNFRLFFTPPIYLKKNKISLKKIDQYKVKKIFYKKIDIGLSVYSSYLTLSRDFDLEGFFSHKILNKLFLCSINISDFFIEHFSKNRISEVFLFNARQNHNRPLLRVAQNNRIKANVLEYTSFFKNYPPVRNFGSNIPSDINFLSKDIEKHWKYKSSKKNYISNYFRYKKSGYVVNDKASYILKQDHNSIPIDWDKSKINIVFFTSSQDEYASFGGDYDKTLFKDQNTALLKLINLFKKNKDKDFHLWIRVHPYSKGIKWNYNKKILALKKISSNIHIIEPDSKVSTYKIMDLCNKVVTYNSTTSVEATYWKKPSILLGRIYFEKLNSSYRPKSIKQIKELIFRKKLRPKSSISALKLASYWIEGGFRQKHFEGNMLDGFKFKNRIIKFSFLAKMAYNFGRFKRNYFYQFFNYHLRKVKI